MTKVSISTNLKGKTQPIASIKTICHIQARGPFDAAKISVDAINKRSRNPGTSGNATVIQLSRSMSV
jgi:hypothetical protein